MNTLAQTRHAAGFCAVLLAPLLLGWAAWVDEPFLCVGTVFVVFPLARSVFGAVGTQPASALEGAVLRAAIALPLVYIATLVLALGLLLRTVGAEPLTSSALVGWTLSVWVTLTFATCVAHELLHRRAALDRRFGHVLAGVAGYAVLGYEHVRHHHRRGDTRAAEWPRITESVWQFAWRRAGLIAKEALGPRGAAVAGPARSPTTIGLRMGLLATATAATAFTWAQGWQGLLVYGSAITLVWFAMQLVTYLQHWGLGDDSIADARQREAAWEDDCRFQSWVTLGLSLHQAHHRDGARPFHALSVTPDSPQPPAGYVLLMVAALCPPLWRRVMLPALAYWKDVPSAVRPSAGRRIACVAPYR